MRKAITVVATVFEGTVRWAVLAGLLTFDLALAPLRMAYYGWKAMREGR